MYCLNQHRTYFVQPERVVYKIASDFEAQPLHSPKLMYRNISSCGKDPSVYCPGGSWEPTPISTGYYSVGGTGANTRTGQVCCFGVRAIRSICTVIKLTGEDKPVIRQRYKIVNVRMIACRKIINNKKMFSREHPSGLGQEDSTDNSLQKIHCCCPEMLFFFILSSDNSRCKLAKYTLSEFTIKKYETFFLLML